MKNQYPVSAFIALFLPLPTRSGESPDFPVAVENDANLAAVAEHRYGGYAGVRHLALISGGVGVGAGVGTPCIESASRTLAV